jgi:AcrR family transcriptional regulator
MITSMTEARLAPARRRRDAEATRAALLDAALDLFAQHGVDAVGVRDVAERAAADQALINRYFGSKDGLITAALRDEHAARFPEVLDAPDAHLGRALVDYVLSDKPNRDTDILLALLRSTGNPTAAHLLRDGWERNLVTALTQRLPG